MKENYICIKDNVFIDNVTNFGVNVIKRPYQDNIEEILRTENIIEALENENKNYKESIKLKENSIKNRVKKNISIVIASVIIGLFISLISFFVNPFSITNILLGILSTIGSFSLLSHTFINNLKRIKTIKKEIDGLNLATTVLEVKEEEAKNLLAKLEKNNTQNKTNYESNKIKKINYLDKLIEIKNLLGLYCSIGANEEEFKKYYKDGSLDFKLADDFSEQDRIEIKTYLKEKK